MKRQISSRQLEIMRELHYLGVPLTEISRDSGISYSRVRAALKNGQSTLRPIEPIQKVPLEEILRGERKKHPSFTALFSEREDIDRIVRTKEGIEKIVALAAESGWLAEHFFTPHHCYNIVRAGGEWRAKLEWLIQNYQEVLQPLGFNGSHVAQIVIGAGWDKKLNWIKENYQEVLRYGFTPARIAYFFNAEDWQDLTVHWHDALSVFPLLRVTDSAISPLTNQYLARLLMSGTSVKEVTTLKEKCTEEALAAFKDKVGTLAGIRAAAAPQEVFNILSQKYGYQEQEIRMYLVAMNKNSRGLVTWYTTGIMYSTEEISLDTVITKDQMSIAEEIVERKMALKRFIDRAAAKDQERYFWKRFIVDYQADVEMLTPDERKTFDILVGKIKEDKPLLAELYDLLRA